MLAIAALPWQPPRAEATTFTLVGTADGGVPSGRRLVLGHTLVIVSTDSGAPVRYTIDLRWVRDSLPAIDQDDLLEVEIQVLPDGTLVATSIVNVSDRSGSVNQGQSTGSRTSFEAPRSNVNDKDKNDKDDRPDANTVPSGPTSTPTPTPTATPTATSTATATPTVTLSATATNTPNTTVAATATNTPTTAADLALAKTVSNASPASGTNVTFTITLTNNGPNPATGVAVTDLLPAGLVLQGAAPSQGTYDAGTGVWTVGAMANGATQTLYIVARADSPATNSATISSSSQPDPTPANNSASATVTPQ
jgi:uncharacterized repeat protein (TIGR01451 family)